MRVSTQENSVTARFARWALGCAVRYWPEENRAWGLALAAEIDETATAFETIWWSLGGIMFFTRSVVSSAWKWMKLPAGSSLSGGVDRPDGPLKLPKRSRLLTTAIVAMAALLLLLPEGREAIRTVRASWQGYQETESDFHTLEKLAARAEKEKDASTLAFVALSMKDPKRAAVFTDCAVSLNPELIWVYGSRNHRQSNDPPREEWLARLQAAEPGNAVPYLLEADALADPRVEKLYEHGTPREADLDVLASDPKWVALMDRASHAQRYDSYFERHYQLTRKVWNREGNLSPSIVLNGLWQHALPSLLNLRIYSEIKIHEAQKARAAGDLKRAESLLGELDAFGRRMANGSVTRIEKLIAMSISRRADKELAALYSSSGRTEDERRVKLQIEKIDKTVQAFRPGQDSTSEARRQAFRREGMLVQGFGTLAVLAAFAALAGILLLELWPARIRNVIPILRGAACWAADYAPAILLVASGAFLLSFLPFQRAFAEYRSSNYALADQERLIEVMWSLVKVPDHVKGADADVFIWSFVTMVLTAILLFVLARSIFHKTRPAPNPA